MKRTTILLAGLLLCCTVPDVAADEREMLAQVAKEAGVSIDDVRMVLGSRTQHAQYRSTYDRKEARVKAALSRVLAQRKMAEEALTKAETPSSSQPEPAPGWDEGP